VAFQLIDAQKFNQDYRGHAEKCIYTFSVWLPDQIGASWTAQQMLNGHIEELQAQGSVLLEYKLYEDKAPTFTTDYKVEIIASASPLWWNLIIIGVLGLLSILFVSWSINSVADIAEYAPGAVMTWGIAAIALAVVGGIFLLKRRE
jgi:hypothetical protein